MSSCASSRVIDLSLSVSPLATKVFGLTHIRTSHQSHNVRERQRAMTLSLEVCRSCHPGYKDTRRRSLSLLCYLGLLLSLVTFALKKCPIRHIWPYLDPYLTLISSPFADVTTSSSPAKRVDSTLTLLC